MTEKITLSLSGVPETLLIPLYQRAQGTQRPDAMFKDDKAMDIVQKLDCDLSRFKLQKHDIVALALRVREFDRFVRDFLSKIFIGQTQAASAGASKCQTVSLNSRLALLRL